MFCSLSWLGTGTFSILTIKEESYIKMVVNLNTPSTSLSITTCDNQLKNITSKPTILTSIDVISIADVLIQMSNVTSVSETITVGLKYLHF
jgi:hypothetical protein